MKSGLSAPVSSQLGRLRIDLGALCANFRRLAATAAPARCAAVVKADAYGLGAAPVVSALARASCRDFFVAHLEEALALRGMIGAEGVLYVLNGVARGAEAVCADAGIIPVLSSVEQCRAWQAFAQTRGGAAPAALQIDTGMSRLGLDLQSAAELAQDAGFLAAAPLRLLMTHLACADTPAHPANAAQLAAFAQARALFPQTPASIANSGGIFLGAAFQGDLVRPGVALYGAAPSSEAMPLQRVVTLDAPVLQIRTIPAGAGVGYGLDYAASAPRRIATLGIGYADGWPRHLGGRGAAWRGGVRLPMIGRVSMDSMSVDVSALAPDTLAEGDLVELIGPSQSLEDVAREAGAIAYEILTRLGARLHRTYAHIGD